MQIPILNGITADSSADFRTSYPRNLIPVPKGQGISNGYLRPADGIVSHGTGLGDCRGGISWNGAVYRVSGTKLISEAQDGSVTVLGDVGAGRTVRMTYSFDRLGIASGGKLYYWDGHELTHVTDPDLGQVVDVKFIAGYFMTTDGTSLVVTDLTDPTAVSPLKYGSAESDPDPVLAVDELRNEAYAFGRYTIEVFRNVGGDLFPFSRIDGAQVPRGVIGTHAVCKFAETFAFVGSGLNEPPAVHLMGAGVTEKISTREIDVLLLGYSEADLASCVVEARADKAHMHLLVHLPDRCLVYDRAASANVGEPVWFSLDSGIGSPLTYRARHLVWCYDRWNVGDPNGTGLGHLSSATGEHFGSVVGWEFGTMVLYADGNDAIVHELELVTLPGRVALGANPVVWTSYTVDGETWSTEYPKACGKQGERGKRLVWRKQGRISHYRMQKFRGTSDAHLTMVRLEADLEPLLTRTARG